MPLMNRQAWTVTRVARYCWAAIALCLLLLATAPFTMGPSIQVAANLVGGWRQQSLGWAGASPIQAAYLAGGLGFVAATLNIRKTIAWHAARTVPARAWLWLFLGNWAWLWAWSITPELWLLRRAMVTAGGTPAELASIAAAATLFAASLPWAASIGILAYVATDRVARTR